MTSNQFGIGNTLENMVFLSDLVAGPPWLAMRPPSPPYSFNEWGRETVRADGTLRQDGYASFSWRWDSLKQTHIDALAAYKNKEVAVNTYNHTGKYQTYTALMGWPRNILSARQVGSDIYTNVEIPFTRLELPPTNQITLSVSQYQTQPGGTYKVTLRWELGSSAAFNLFLDVGDGREVIDVFFPYNLIGDKITMSDILIVYDIGSPNDKLNISFTSQLSSATAIASNDQGGTASITWGA